VGIGKTSKTQPQHLLKLSYM